MGSFDVGFGVWRLKDRIGRKKATEMRFCNDRRPAKEAKALSESLGEKREPDAAEFDH